MTDQPKFDVIDLKTDKTILSNVSFKQADDQIKRLKNDRYMIVAAY